MSTDYDVYCLDCEEGMGLQDWNVPLDELQDICRNAFAFMPLARASINVAVCNTWSSDRRIDLAWLLKHEGHRLAVRSEYGEIDGTCGKRVVCPHCKSHVGYCRLAIDHDGQCIGHR